MEGSVDRELGNVNLSQIAALQQKRTLAFINHFVMINIQFLNNFMKTCDERLMLFERKLENVHATMVLLESKLYSIPELNETEVMDSQPACICERGPPAESAGPDLNDLDHIPVRDVTPAYPEYDRFVKMVQVGVPLQAVKIKVTLEGLNPNILEELLKK